jgi:acyl-CoA synthetase (AMP-forming)/AMP-acid ligase II
MRPRTFVDALRDRAASTRAENGYTFLKEGEGPGERLSYAELDRRARALAALLQERGAAGERTLLPLPAGLDFITALFGCFYAGALAVPLLPPDPSKPAAGVSHLELVARGSGARFALSKGGELRRAQGLATLEWLDLDAVDAAVADFWRPPRLDEATPALIQYTSGSTSEPKGVVVRHSNLIANALAIQDVFRISQDSRGVSWLPPHHDMGLMGGILEPLLLGAETALMPPQAFLQRPLRWLAAITRFRATTCGGPGFAYELLARRVPEAAKAELDLSSWSVAFCGAEAVRAEVLDSFERAFAPCGFRREAFLPCYGLAEATLMVTGERAGARPTVLDLDPKALEQGHFEPAASSAPGRPVVGCGRPARGVEVRIVDPESREPRPVGHVGEVWVKGAGVAAGYWNEDEETRRSFDARLGNGEGPYLRTGDLGFLHKGELFPTGRLKDLIIVRGRNLYPQDLEATLERAHAAVRPGRAVAFSTTTADEEQLIVACEVNRRIKAAPSEITDALKRSIAFEHGVLPHAVVLLEPGALPRTSSGKPRRPICRALFEKGRLGSDQEPEGVGGS